MDGAELSQAHLKDIQQHLRFRYIRLNTLLTDDLFEFFPDTRQYRFTDFIYLTEFLRKIGLTPMLAFGGGRRITVSGVIFTEGGYSVSQESWLRFLRDLLRVSIRHWGAAWVSTWRFEFFMPPTLYGSPDPDAFFDLFEASVQLIKEMLPQAAVGGPAQPLVDGIGCWKAYNSEAEYADEYSLLSSGCGIVERLGLHYPAWYAWRFLQSLYPNLVFHGSGTCVTTDGEGRFALLLHNCKNYSRVFCKNYLEPEALGFLGRRQQHSSYTATAAMEFAPAEGEAAGLVLTEENHNQLRLELTTVSGRQLVQVVRGVSISNGMASGRQLLPDLPPCPYENGSVVLGQIPWAGGPLVLRLDANGQANSFYAGRDEDHLVPVALNIDGSFLGSETSGSFVGAYIGMFATSNGAESDNEAVFDWFRYVGKS